MSHVKTVGLNSQSEKVAQVNGWVDEGDKGKEKVSLFQEFAQNATVHGLKHTGGTRHGTFRRTFWILAFLGMLTSLFYTIFSQVAVMMTYPTKTQQSLEFRAKVPFPAVTLCNLNVFRKSLIGSDPRVRQTLLALSDLGQFSGPINWNDSIWDFDPVSGEEMEEQLAHIAHPLSETLYLCTWDNKPYECSDIFSTQKTDLGMCYTFNGRDTVNNTPRYAVRSGSNYGLSLVANIHQDEYMLSSSSDAAGLRVVLHDPSETPLVEGRGFEVSPGTSTKASLKLTQVNYLPPPYTSYYGIQCTNISGEEFTNFLQLYENYDMGACVSECRYNYIVSECGCRSLFDLGNETVCHPRDSLECYYPRFEKFMFENKDWECECPMPCQWNLFDAEVSMSAYPSSAMMEQVNTLLNISISEDQFRRDYLKLTFSYDRFLVEEISQVPEFSFETVMSTLGGQLGIFIGASILSILEFIEFGMELFFCSLFKSGRKTAPQK